MVKVVKTNREGYQLSNNGSYWSITKPNAPGSVTACSVSHVGNEKYIKKIWNEKFAIIKTSHITEYGIRCITGQKQDISAKV